MDLKRFSEISGYFSNKTVMTIGDLMLDTYLWGDTDRISPEAPVPIVNISQTNTNPGGAGNVALNLAKLGCRSIAVGVVGNDDHGRALKHQMDKYGIQTDGIIIDDSRPTTVKTRVIAQNQQVLRIDQEEKGPIPEEIQEKLLDLINQYSKVLDGVILEDYDKGVFTPEMIENIIGIFKSENKPVYVDPKINHFYSFKKVRLIKPNMSEFLHAYGKSVTDAQFEQAGKELREKTGVEMIMVTRGSQGISMFLSKSVTHIPTHAKTIVDVSGAGDTVISAFALSDLSGATPDESAMIANFAAGAVCAEIGAVPVTISKIKKIIKLFSL